MSRYNNNITQRKSIMSSSSSSDDDFDFFHQRDVMPYRFEPSFSKEEIEARKRLRDTEAANEASSQPSSAENRTEDRSWCTCGHCVIMPTEVECRCCHEIEQAQDIVRAVSTAATTETGPSTNEQKCVTQHTDFQPHLNEGVLDTYFRSHQYNWRKFPKPRGPNGTLTNAQFRLVAYRFILDWLLKGERLGKKKRIPLPACIVHRIRTKYPADDQEYAGFQFAELPTL